MKHHPACPAGRHVHAYDRTIGTFVVATPVIAWDDDIPLFITGDHALADRIVELLERHGLADVPDDASTIAAPWPAPDPKDRHT